MATNTIGYFGKVPTKSSNVKQYSLSTSNPLAFWTFTENSINNNSTITPYDLDVDVLIPNNLIVYGSIYNPSDLRIKENIKDITLEETDKLMKIIPKQYNFINSNETHYGLIAQDVEKELPLLVKNTKDENHSVLKTINYLEMVPLLLLKIQDLQKQIDELKNK